METIEKYQIINRQGDERFAGVEFILSNESSCNVFHEESYLLVREYCEDMYNHVGLGKRKLNKDLKF